MTVNGMLVCEKCGKSKGGRRRRRRWGTRRRRRRRGARMRGGAIAGALVVAAVVGILVMPGSLEVLEDLISSGDPLESLRGGPRPGSEPPPDSGDDAPSRAPDGSPGDPPSAIDLLSDTVWPASPLDSEWSMSPSPGSFEAQLARFTGQGARPDVLKRVLILDSPTELSFSFGNQSRVYSHFLLDTWYENRGLAELDKRDTAQGLGVPSLAANTSRPQHLADGKIWHTRADVPPRDSDLVESLVEAAYDRSASLDRLYNVALDAINGHRTAMGREPVQLSDNTAAQMHAQDVLEQLAISHYMSNGEKPYMTYSMTGGAGYVAQNVAFGGYDRPWQCGGYVICTKIDPATDILAHHNGMMFDDAHADWGHRDNILDPYHTHVSLGVAYTDYTLVFVQNFETRRIEGVGPAGGSANPISLDGAGRITVAGSMDAGLDVHSIDVYYDPLPSTRTYRMHANDMSYGLGDPIAYVYEPHPYGYVPMGKTIIMADRWNTSGGTVLIEFDAPAGMSKNGAYTFYVWLTDGIRPPFT